MPRAIIIGAGVTGLSTAYHLKRFGWNVTVVDKGPVGDGSSSRAAGICTGLLWTEAGIKVRQRCFELYTELSRDLAGYTFRQIGCLNLFSADTWPDRAALLHLYDELGAPYEIVPTQGKWPALHVPEDVVGLWDPLGGYSEPSEYLPALAAAVGNIIENTAVTDFIPTSGTISGVRLADGRTLEADAVVCTVYAWSNLLLARIGVPIAAKAFVHQRFVSDVIGPINIPAVNANPWGIYVRPALGGRILAGIETMDRVEQPVLVPDFRYSALTIPDDLQAETEQRTSALLGESITFKESSIGLLTFSMDGEPILGPVQSHPGLFLGLAFHSGGFAYNPGTGELLAEYVANGKTTIDVSTWLPDRFDPAEVTQYLAETIAQKDVSRRRH